ncbi:MAG: phosphatase PAP2 family protein [Chitinispirillaceae bacterium]|nr:phosphatase PAP2 family protein [Chitinispirillaceae bacterium]
MTVLTVRSKNSTERSPVVYGKSNKTLFLKSVLTIHFLSILAFSDTLPQNLSMEFPYRLSVHDVPIALSGTLLLGSGALLSHLHEKEYTPTETVFDKTDIPPFDRPASRMWRPSLDKTGDFVLGGLLLGAPAVLLCPAFRDHRWMDFLTMSCMYGETMLFSLTASRWSKALAGRYRPYNYNSDIPPETFRDITGSDDARRSFFSSHTALAFGSSVFLSTVIADVYGTGLPTRLIQASSLTIATGIGVSRILAGEHFPTDVLAGAGVGTLIGYLVPRLHRSKTGTSIYFSGDGIVMTWKY